MRIGSKVEDDVERRDLVPVAELSQRAFTVVSMKPCAGAATTDTIRTVCKEIPGVSALRVDADRGKIHLLYDGDLSTLEQVERVLETLGHSFHHPDERPSSLCLARVREDPV